MKNKTTKIRKVTDMSRKELGTVVYHIAQHTRVSLDYTQWFIQDVLMRASELLSVEPLILWDLAKEDEDEDCDPFNLNEVILRDYQVDGLTYKIPVKDDVNPRDLTGAAVKTCWWDESIICHCSLGDILRCQLSEDREVPKTCTSHANAVSSR